MEALFNTEIEDGSIEEVLLSITSKNSETFFPVLICFLVVSKPYQLNACEPNHMLFLTRPPNLLTFPAYNDSYISPFVI